MPTQSCLNRIWGELVVLTARSITPKILAVVFFNFIGYLTIGIPLAVLPPYVQSLGYGPVLAGIAISVQYLATFLTRAGAGRRSDSKGPKQTVVIGLLACGLSGVLLLLTAWFEHIHWLGLSCLFASRLALGWGESFVTTAAILWGIGRVGPVHTARVISWNGITTYGAIAIGAPLGIVLEKHFGFAAIGASVVLLAWLSVPVALSKAVVETIPGKPIPMHRVFGRILPYGIALALGSIGFGSLATFITLYYAGHQWPNAAFALTAFGIFFIGVRLWFASTIDRFGGHRVAVVCFAIECAGLSILWLANSATMAFLGAMLTGIGFSLVFPSLGLLAVNRVTSDNRGAALAMYSLFVDVALGLIGPIGGWIASRSNFNSVFLFAASSALCAMGLIWTLYMVKFGGSEKVINSDVSLAASPMEAPI